MSNELPDLMEADLGVPSSHIVMTWADSLKEISGNLGLLSRFPKSLCLGVVFGFALISLNQSYFSQEYPEQVLHIISRFNAYLRHGWCSSFFRFIGAKSSDGHDHEHDRNRHSP